MNLYISEDLEKQIRTEAKRRRLSLSAYLTSLIRNRVGWKGWREGFFTRVVGGWQGEVPEIERELPEEGAPGSTGE